MTSSETGYEYGEILYRCFTKSILQCFTLQAEALQAAKEKRCQRSAT